MNLKLKKLSEFNQDNGYFLCGSLKTILLSIFYYRNKHEQYAADDGRQCAKTRCSVLAGCYRAEIINGIPGDPQAREKNCAKPETVQYFLRLYQHNYQNGHQGQSNRQHSGILRPCLGYGIKIIVYGNYLRMPGQGKNCND